jgi:hypothetical protein
MHLFHFWVIGCKANLEDPLGFLDFAFGSIEGLVLAIKFSHFAMSASSS